MTRPAQPDSAPGRMVGIFAIGPRNELSAGGSARSLQAIELSGSLVVICSPRAPPSGSPMAIGIVEDGGIDASGMETGPLREHIERNKEGTGIQRAVPGARRKAPTSDGLDEGPW